jgi:hypothetical protein
MKKWLERRKQGELARVNPTDTIELCKTIRHQQNNKMYDFYLQALTQTGDSHDRRVKIHAQDEEKMNTYCLFCNNEHESLRHIYTCKTVHDMYLRKLQTISQVIDPLDEFKGKLCWFRIDDNRTLSERWASKFKAYEREDKVDKMDEKLKAIESHDRFAGMLGIMPKGLHTVLTKLLLRTQPTTTLNEEKALQQARQQAASCIKHVRKELMQLALAIWLKWRAKQRTYKRVRGSEIQASVPKTTTPTVKKKKKLLIGATPAHSKGRRRPTGRDKSPKLHKVKKKSTPRFHHQTW